MESRPVDSRLLGDVAGAAEAAPRLGREPTAGGAERRREHARDRELARQPSASAFRAAERRPRPRAHAIGVRALLLGSLVFAACPTSSFRYGGDSRRPGKLTQGAPGAGAALLEALPAPRVEVTPERPLVGWLARCEVVAHAPLGGGGFRLDLRTEEGKEVTVRYELGAGRRLALEAGDAARVRYYPSRPKGDPRSSALVVAAGDGRALGIVVRHDGLPGGVLPGGARVAAARGSDKLVYTEVRQLPSLCVARIAHHAMVLTTEESTTYIPPGGAARVTIARTPFLLVAYDASRLADERCRGVGQDPSHLSYALLLAPQAPLASP